MRYYKGMEKKCASCGGTGQLGHFQGISRFIITWEECSDCLGSGIAAVTEQEKKEKNATTTVPPPNTTENQE